MRQHSHIPNITGPGIWWMVLLLVEASWSWQTPGSHIVSRRFYVKVVQLGGLLRVRGEIGDQMRCTEARNRIVKSQY